MIDITPSTVSSPIRILLIEDNEHDRAAFERALRNSEMPLSVSVFEKAEKALHELADGRNAYDLVVVDYDLPGMTGMDFYRRLQHSNNLPPFVMLTGAGSENLAVEALQAGMYDYIIKDPEQGYLKLLPLKLADVRQRKNERKARRKAQVELKKAHDELEKRVADSHGRIAGVRGTAVAAVAQDIGSPGNRAQTGGQRNSRQHLR